jgi:hypothetical protein
MNRLILTLTLSFSMVSWAGPREDAVAQALDSVQDAQDEAEDATGSCKKSLRDLDDLSDKLSALKKDATDKGLSRAKDLAEELSDAAKEDCKGSLAKRVRKSLDKAVTALERAQETKTAGAPPAPAPANGAQANVFASLAGGIGSLFAGAKQETQVNKTETRSSSRTEEINGRSIDGDDDDEGEPAPAAKKKVKEAPSRGGFQATCTRNSDCDSNTCFVGKGNLGYCTKMCNSFSDCPSFWECKRAANAPQNICMQR